MFEQIKSKVTSEAFKSQVKEVVVTAAVLLATAVVIRTVKTGIANAIAAHQAESEETVASE